MPATPAPSSSVPARDCASADIEPSPCRSLADCLALDQAPSPLDSVRDRFASGAPDTFYFDANSIGPMPADASTRVQSVMDEGWREARRQSWNLSDWLAQPRSLGARLARVLGAQPDDVVVCDTTSVNQYKLLHYALQVSGRTTLVVERDVFPSNRYVAEGLLHAAGARELQWRLIDHPEELEQALAPGDVAVVALSHVDYRSSTRLDMAALTRLAHRHGALALWDLSHSAGAIDVALTASDADFALGCGYKYLCGGPGAPAFLYVHPRHQQAAWPAICGWMGHADTFAFEPGYQPAPGVGRFLAGTPAVLANAAMGAAADIWRDIDPVLLQARHASLGDALIALIDSQCAGLGIEVASPRDHRCRGGHVALRFAHAQALSQALAAAGVVVSARKPDALRFGIHALTTRHTDLWWAVQRLRDILASGTWREPRFAGAQV